jgi:hypothetical protein
LRDVRARSAASSPASGNASVARSLGDQHRLRSEAGQRVEDIPRLEVFAGDGDRGLRGERTGEDAETVERPPFHLVEQRVRPLDGRPQRLVAFDGRTPSPGQETETLVEVTRDLHGCHRRHASSRQLQRQRHPVEAPAHLENPGDVGVVHREAGPGIHGARHEQLHRLARRPLTGVVREGQRSHTQDPLTVERERLATRRQHADMWAIREDEIRDLGSRVDHVLTIVEYQQELLRGEELDDAAAHVEAGP